MITALVLHLAVAQLYPFNRAREAQRLHGAREANNYAFFEAFPSSGAGTTTACSTTAPTGARGEALTFTRASNGTCTKTATGGLATTGIADGDLVSLSTNVTRVEYDSAGTLGLLVEAARTNSDLRSEEIDNAWWSNVATVVANPTLNGTCATSPLASPASMPEDYTFPATAAGQQSGRLGTTIAALTAVAGTHSYFVKGVSGSGTMDICAWNTTTPTCAPCAYVDTSWTRCTFTATSSGNVATFIGNNTLYNGGTARASNRVCVTGAQAEAGAYATSYIPTVAATATRALDNGAFAVPASVWASQGSAAMSWTPDGTNAVVGSLSFSANGRIMYGTGTNIAAYDGTNNPTTAASAVAGSLKRYWASWSTAGGWVVRNETSGNQSTSAFTVGTWATDTSLDLNVAGIIPDGIISRICLDPDPSRCR